MKCFMEGHLGQLRTNLNSSMEFITKRSPLLPKFQKTQGTSFENALKSVSRTELVGRRLSITLFSATSLSRKPFSK